MIKEIDKFLARSSLTLREALKLIDQGARGLILLVDHNGKLLRTVTDGDVRRLLLESNDLSSTLEELPAKAPKVVKEDVSSAAALQVMNQAEVDHLPVVDDEGKPVGLLVRRDIDDLILLSTPHLGEYEQKFVEQAFTTNWIAPLGPNVDAFEQELAEHVGVAHAAAVNSGTAALHLALRLLGVGSGDVVFCSSLTFVASANPILYQGAEPVFIDSEPTSWNMSPKALAQAFVEAETRGQLPKAVIVVNLYGQSADYDVLNSICESYGVPIIEDAAESLGATYKGKGSGTLGRIGIYSFNGNKIITTSGGGMLVSDDGDLMERARFLSTQGREPTRHYEHRELAYNYRMSNVLAGIGRGQLRVLNDRVAARRAVFDRYANGLKEIRAIRWMPDGGFGLCTRWLSVGLVEAQADLNVTNLIEYLGNERIEARPVWKPMHLQPLYADCRYYPHEEGCSISDRLFADGICLPSGSNMQIAQQERIIDAIRRYFE
jgi:dTDP-4-amino-4,6-dideoxygalactose transaminase